MRRIAYVTSLYFADESCIGGAERYTQNLARGLVLESDGRYEVDLISFGACPFTKPIEPGVTLHVLEAANRPKDVVDVVSWALPAALDKADLVHVQQSRTRCGEVAILLAKQLRKPVCATDHGAFSSAIGMEYGLPGLVDSYVAYSDFGASLLPSGNASVRVIKGGVDASAFTPSPHPIPRDRVVFVGRLLPHKGIDRLIEAMPPDLLLSICGKPYHAEYFALLQRLSVGKRVEFLIDADDAAIVALYRRAWAAVLPSVHHDCYGNSHIAPELMGLTLLEAMACGTPAVASRLAAMPEFIRQGETGFLFDSVEELSVILSRLAEDPDSVERIGRQARSVVTSEFDIRPVGRSLIQLYDELIDARRLGKVA